MLTSRFSAKREYLKDVVPLKTPYVIGLYPTDACNLKCHYCLHQNPLNDLVKRGCAVYEPMEWETFISFADALPNFSERIKVLQISGFGEPTLHKDLPKMVEYLKSLNCIDQIKIVTNGLMLSHDLIDQLLAGGVNRFEVSIQGINSEMYKKNAGVDMDFEKFHENLKYLFQVRGNAKIYMQTLESCIPDEKDRDRFLELYSGVCDYINIAPTLPVDEGVDFQGKIKADELINSNYKQVCHQAFYQCFVLPDGLVVPCCNPERVRGSLSYGNVRESSLTEIWGGQKHRAILADFLRFKRRQMPSCATCVSPNRAIFPYDDLDTAAKTLLPLFE